MCQGKTVLWFSTLVSVSEGGHLGGQDIPLTGQRCDV